MVFNIVLLHLHIPHNMELMQFLDFKPLTWYQTFEWVLRTLHFFYFIIIIAFPFQNMHQARHQVWNGNANTIHILSSLNAMDAESLGWHFLSLIHFGIIEFYLHTLRFCFLHTRKCCDKKKPRTLRKKIWWCNVSYLYCADGKCRIGVRALMRWHICNNQLIIDKPSQTSLKSHPSTPTKTATYFLDSYKNPFYGSIKPFLDHRW